MIPLDAMHVALATVVRADAIVSWNFRHIVHLDKMRRFNQVNLAKGYGPLTIVSPNEVRSTTMSKADDKYDCLAAKDAAQRRILRRIAGLPPEEQIAAVRRDIEKSPLGEWWRSLPVDPGPQPEPVGTRGIRGSRT